MDIAALNKQRKILRYVSLAVAGVEIVAIMMILGGVKLPGLLLGLAALIGGAAYKRKGRKAYEEECCRYQTLGALGVMDAQYTDRIKMGENWMHQTHLLPASAQTTQPLLLHHIKGTLHGMKVEIAEMTFGCQEANKKQPTYSSGVLVRADLPAAGQKRVLLLGRYAFKHAALRNEYEKDGLRLSPAGGKEKGWYALTDGAVSPDETLLNKWQSVCDTAKMRAALYVEDGCATAFLNGSFYTGEFPLEEEVTQSSFKRHTCTALVPLMEMLESI